MVRAYTLHPKDWILNPRPHPKPYTLHNPKPYALHPAPYTLHA